jgi:hypothetical protein
MSELEQVITKHLEEKRVQEEIQYKNNQEEKKNKQEKDIEILRKKINSSLSEVLIDELNIQYSYDNREGAIAIINYRNCEVCIASWGGGFGIFSKDRLFSREHISDSSSLEKWLALTCYKLSTLEQNFDVIVRVEMNVVAVSSEIAQRIAENECIKLGLSIAEYDEH